MDDLPATEYLLLAPIILSWVGAVVSWGFTAYYMFKIATRFHPDRQWGKFVPISIFLPWFFTDEGNIYRAKLLKAGALFLLFLALGIAIALGLDVRTKG
jgi:hypothetical protein